MTTDIFQSKLSKKDQLLNFIRDRKFVRTSEIIKWGTENYSNRSDRDARLLASEGKIKRMDDFLKNSYYGSIKEDVWEYIGGIPFQENA